jgi:branched-chain amino acid transport system ATP-binding protein
VSLLEVHDITRTFGGICALDSLSFSVEAGAIYSVIGPNGAGKTTLFNLITGVYKPTAGRIVFDDRDVTGMAPSIRAVRGMSRTFQNLQIFFNMTVRENVMVGRHRHLDSRVVPALFRLPGLARADNKAWEEVGEILDFVGLGEYLNSDSDRLPYGALKRLEIARALATEPKMLLLDEPAAGLNQSETREVDALIGKIAARGVTILLVEHDMKLVMDVSDHILVLDSGRKLAEGTAAEVRANPDVVAAYLGRSATGGVP